jgi:hypothetical protein
MTVKELIEWLQKEPPLMPVCVWDGSEGVEEFVEVEDVLYEDGTSAVHLLTYDAGPRERVKPE